MDEQLIGAGIRWVDTVIVLSGIPPAKPNPLPL